MADDGTYRGQWWRPGSPADIWHGTLAYADRRLELDVEVPESSRSPFDAPGFEPILYGHATNGTIFTLCDLNPYQWTTHMPGRVRAIFRVRLASLGAWFDDADDLRFHNVDARFDLLDRWLGISGFDFRYLGPQTGFDLSYRVPDSHVIASDSDIAIKAEFSASSPSIGHPLVEIKVVQRARLTITPKDRQPLEDHEERVRRIRNFLSFACRRDIALIDLHGVATVDVRERDGGLRAAQERLRMLLGAEPKQSEPNNDPLLLYAIDRTATDEAPLLNWLASYQQLGPIFELFLIALYQPNIYLHLQFLSLAQAIESLHGRKFPDWDMPRDEFLERRELIIASAPDELKDWLAEKLQHANQAQFRKAIEELVTTLPAVLRDLIPDPSAFARLVGFTRNYYTHWSQSLEAKAAHDEELYRLTAALKLIVEALLLVELRFGVEEAQAILTRDPRLAQERDFAFVPPLGRPTVPD